MGEIAYHHFWWRDQAVEREWGVKNDYWYGPVYLGVPQNVFAGGQFWYYYNKVIPSPTGEKMEVWEMDLKKEIENLRNEKWIT